jgi:hypothetical protein
LLVAAVLGDPALAQPEIWGRPVQVHGFLSQGFMYTGGGNNYMTAPTSRGTFGLTDGGLNASIRLTDKLRAGAQIYARNVGNLGQGHATLDWGLVDYRFRDWLGVRAGKVKTVYGLYNDTQDMEFLHTWALLPQSLYPLDLRGLSIAHTGADVYGTVPMGDLGSVSYNAYAGSAPADPDGGRVYGVESFGVDVERLTGRLRGADVKWNPPLSGLLLGVGWLHSPNRLEGRRRVYGWPISINAKRSSNLVFSAQYTRGGLRLEWERTRIISLTRVANPFGPQGPPEVSLPYDARGWYAAGAYRLSKRFEIGSYHSRFYSNANRIEIVVSDSPHSRHVIDHAMTLRVDFGNHLDLKTEGHFINGFGDPATSRGFYPQDNPRGLRPRTNLLVIRLGFNW